MSNLQKLTYAKHKLQLQLNTIQNKKEAIEVKIREIDQKILVIRRTMKNN